MDNEFVCGRWTAIKLAWKLFTFATGTPRLSITTSKEVVIINGADRIVRSDGGH